MRDLAHRGGLRATVLEGGELRVGDSVCAADDARVPARDLDLFG